MDWREMAGWPTVHGLSGDDRRGWGMFRGAYSGGRRIGTGTWFKDGSNLYRWDGRTDPMRGWVIAVCWLFASCCEYVHHRTKRFKSTDHCVFSAVYLYHLVKRPRLILDFAATLLFNHIVLTTYYSAALPSSIFFWVVVVACSAGTVVVTEHFCVRREMREGLQTIPTEIDEIELGNRGANSRRD